MISVSATIAFVSSHLAESDFEHGTGIESAVLAKAKAQRHTKDTKEGCHSLVLCYEPWTLAVAIEMNS